MPYDGQAKSVEVLRSLLHGEIAAIETYTRVIEAMSQEERAARLRRLRADHVEAASLLRRYVTDHAARPPFAPATDGATAVPGDGAALEALKERERRAIEAYESVIRRDEVDRDVRDLILRTILPRQRARVAEVERLLSV